MYRALSCSHYAGKTLECPEVTLLAGEIREAVMPKRVVVAEAVCEGA